MWNVYIHCGVISDIVFLFFLYIYVKRFLESILLNIEFLLIFSMCFILKLFFVPILQQIFSSNKFMKKNVIYYYFFICACSRYFKTRVTLRIYKTKSSLLRMDDYRMFLVQKQRVEIRVPLMLYYDL